ncbi:MAG: hypothetical protein JKY93_03615 [Gammaproteobacteria bacterium]|nr:hypothetical protein [Gammaproteobacteria bacterium]
MDPRAAGRIAARLNPDEIMDHLQEASGAPANIYVSREAADEIQAAEAEQAQQQQAMQMAGQGAGIAKDLAAAGLMDAGQDGEVAA